MILHLEFSEDAYPDLEDLDEAAILRPPERCSLCEIREDGVSFHFDEPYEHVSSALDSIFSFLRREKIEARFIGGSYSLTIPLIGPSLERVTEFCP